MPSKPEPSKTQPSRREPPRADAPLEQTRTLAPHQVEAFDVEYVTPPMQAALERLIAERFGERPFRFLDIGGGNGVFTDRVLEAFPQATAILADRSAEMLARNQPHPRKRLVQASAERLDEALPADERADVIFLNWVLHHLVLDSYGATRRMQRRVLADLRARLRPGGVLSVFENLYEGWPHPGAPGRLIYHLTSRRSLAPFTRRMGANTAGVGVCFLCGAEWRAEWRRGGWSVLAQSVFEPWEVSWTRRAFLGVREVRIGHFWLSPEPKPPVETPAPDAAPNG